MKNIWLNEYPKKLASKLVYLENNTITDLLESASDEFSEKIAFSSMQTNISFKMINLLSKRLAAYVILGVKKA